MYQSGQFNCDKKYVTIKDAMGQNTVLVIDDCEVFSQSMLNLLKNNFEVHLCADIKSAKQEIEKHSFDVVFIDLSLPDGKGYELCPYIQQNSSGHSPILFVLSGEMDVYAKITCFELGVDDYLVKPFSSEELMARIQSLLKRKKETLSPHLIIREGKFLLDRHCMQASVGDQALHLTRTEFLILETFLANKGAVFSRDHLLNKVFGEDHHVSGRAMDVHIFSLRRKLGLHASHIKTSYGIGYFFD